MNIEWFTVKNRPDLEQLPEHLRTTGISSKGRVFIAAAIFADAELFVYACAADDRQPIYELDGYVYVPALWAARAFPAWKEVCKCLNASTKRMMKRELLEGK